MNRHSAVFSFLLLMLFAPPANAEQRLTVSATSDLSILYMFNGPQKGALVVDYHAPGSDNWVKAVDIKLTSPFGYRSAIIASANLQKTCGSICEVRVSAYTTGPDKPFPEDQLVGSPPIQAANFYHTFGRGSALADITVIFAPKN